MTRIRRTAPALLRALAAPLAALSLAGCGGAAIDEGDNRVAPAPSASAPTPIVRASPVEEIGDGSPIRLGALTAEDIEAAGLNGELACSFGSDDREILLLARGNVASKAAAQGVVKVADSVERIGAPGGFDGMLRGASFTGRGATIRIEITGRRIGGGESPPAPATLTYLRGDGSSTSIPGQWTCGP